MVVRGLGGTWAQAIAGRPGTASKGWRRWAQEVFHPPQPWRELLGAAIRSVTSAPGVSEDYTYGRLSRRAGSRPGVVLPSLRHRPPRVCVIVDTSGSVSDTELGSALGEVAAICRAVGGRRDLVSVVPCDAAAQVVHPLCRSQEIPLIGGGGTDLRTGFARALRTAPPPDVIVVLTTATRRGRSRVRRARRWWDCSPARTRGGRTTPTTRRTRPPSGPGSSPSAVR